MHLLRKGSKSQSYPIRNEILRESDNKKVKFTKDLFLKKDI